MNSNSGSRIASIKLTDDQVAEVAKQLGLTNPGRVPDVFVFQALPAVEGLAEATAAGQSFLLQQIIA